ncbi:GntR family transcriptional regulator [Mesorhizobium sp.]|uniref:GntR family transcriptional regulator n=1 Tax=Mesorhizobium sp. TaxID=1871066 RepID=UPI0025DFF089|nr:GntR family transcriptional regulator [Mesorhizobium sp.]
MGGPAPAYRRLYALVAKAIAAGELRPGAVLPSERDMAVALGISRVTVRKALAELVAKGLIAQRHGSGNYVCGEARRYAQSLSRLYSFTEDMTARGRRAGTLWLSRERAIAGAGEAALLGVAEGEPIIRLQRLRLADDEPMAVEWSISPASILVDPEQVGASLYETLRALGHNPVSATQHFSAINIDADNARLLQVPVGSAALDIHRTTRLQDGRIVECSHSIFRGDAYDFVAELSLGA